MTSIKLTVNGAKASAKVDGILTSGSVGIPVRIQYDKAWDGLTKNLVCASGKWRPTETPKAILNISDSANVAPEAMIAGNHLYLGIEGRNADGTLVICSTWADCGTVFSGADTDADSSVLPTAPVLAQLQAQIEQLKNPTVSDTQIISALELYFEQNPVKLPDCSENGHLLTDEQINSLDRLFQVCAFTKEDVSAEYAAFKAAFGVPEATMTSISAVYSGGNVTAGTSVNALTGVVVTAHYSDGSTKAVTDYTLSGTIAEGSNTITVTYEDMTTTFIVTGVAEAVTLTSISATYSGGEVAVGTAVTDLTGIVVTAHYSDGTSAAVTGYTLSGTIAEGENTVTVTYQGMTATFTVTGVAEAETPLGVAWTEGVYTLQGSAKTGEGWENFVSSDPVPLGAYTSVCIGANTGVDTLWLIQVSFYDEDNTYIAGSGKSGYLSATNTNYPTPLVFEIPEGAEYAVLSTTISTGSGDRLRYYTDLDWYLE